MANLFDKAKATGATKKVEKHEVVNMPQFTETLKTIEEIDVQMAELQAKRELLDSEIREAGKEAMVNLFNQKQAFPGTLKIVAGERSFQLITADKYIKVDVDRFNELSETYGPELVEEKTRYFFNNVILEKYQDTISDLLMNCEAISQEDRDHLLESETSYSIKKGTLANLATLASKFKTTINNLVSEVRPIFMVKITK